MSNPANLWLQGRQTAIKHPLTCGYANFRERLDAKMDYQEFLKATNGLTDKIAERFCDIYDFVLANPRGASQKIIQDQLNLPRNQVGYVLGGRGLAENPCNQFFEQDPITNDWFISREGKTVGEFIADIREKLGTGARAVSKSEKEMSLARTRLDVAEMMYSDASQDAEKKWSRIVEAKDAEISHLKAEVARLKLASPVGSETSTGQVIVNNEKYLVRTLNEALNFLAEQLRRYNGFDAWNFIFSGEKVWLGKSHELSQAIAYKELRREMGRILQLIIDYDIHYVAGVYPYLHGQSWGPRKMREWAEFCEKNPQFKVYDINKEIDQES